MRLVLDAGALIAFDRGHRPTEAMIAVAARSFIDLVTVAPVVGQAWRDGARQARLARLLRSVEIIAATETTARRAGELLALTAGSDIVGAMLALVVAPGDRVLTSDVDDFVSLLAARGVRAHLVRV